MSDHSLWLLMGAWTPSGQGLMGRRLGPVEGLGLFQQREGLTFHLGTRTILKLDFYVFTHPRLPIPSHPGHAEASVRQLKLRKTRVCPSQKPQKYSGAEVGYVDLNVPTSPGHSLGRGMKQGAIS